MNNSDTKPMELRIPTASLRALLESEPELRMRLDSMACEKIAEELKRKAIRMSMDKFQLEINTAVNKAMADFNATLTAKYRFPDAAKTIITELALDAINRQILKQEAAAQARIDAYFAAKETALNDIIETRVAAAITRQRPEIKKQAREEFLSTLAEARGLL